MAGRRRARSADDGRPTYFVFQPLVGAGRDVDVADVVDRLRRRPAIEPNDADEDEPRR